MPFTNTDRFAVVKSHLGPEELMLSELRGTEGLSQLYSLELSLLSENHEIAFADLVGRDLTVAIDVADEQRFFHGIVAGFTQKWIASADDGGADLSLYTADVVPRLWLLTRYRSSRIFQELTILEIIEQILGEREITDYRFDLDKDNYEPRGYCVQYRETDFAFVCRLLEDEGIYFYFEHEDGKHTWVLTDGSVGHKACALEDVVYFDSGVGDLGEGAIINDLVIGQQIRSSRYTLKDFDFEQPDMDLTATSDAGQDATPGPGDRELYDYPGGHLTLDEGDRRSRLRIEEEEMQVTTISGAGGARTFASGFLFTLERYGRADMNGKQFLLTKIEHHLKQPGFHSEAAGAEEKLAEALYENRFECMDPEVPFRPRRSTQKPTVKGPQTAIVVGPDGEDIHVDKYGRVKVQFHWDREGQKDDNSSCWVRVSQAWAGNGWGSMHIPHVGHEVIVSFLEGDPDRPVVTGRVFHGTNAVPEKLPDNKRKSVFRDEYGNELIFDASSGDEHIRLHSPHHNSTFEIGKSIGGITASDHASATLGNTYEAGAGFKYAAFGGVATDIHLGIVNEWRVAAVLEMLAGGKTEIIAGQVNEIHKGSAFSYHDGKRVEKSEDTITSFANKNNIVSARKTLNLVGGAEENTTSIISGDGKHLSLSIGGNKNPDDHMLKDWQKKEMLGLRYGAITASVVAPVLGAFAELGNINNADKDQNSATAVISGTVALITSALAIHLLTSQSEAMNKYYGGETEPVSHFDDSQDKPEAVVSLFNKGEVNIRGSKKVVLGVEKSRSKIFEILKKGKKAKGPELEINDDLISMRGYGSGTTNKSRIVIGNDGIGVYSQGELDVKAKNQVNIKTQGKVNIKESLQIL